MIQHQQMHQMVMQQMMISQLPGGNRGNSYPTAIMSEPAAPVMVLINNNFPEVNYFRNKPKILKKLS